MLTTAKDTVLQIRNDAVQTRVKVRRYPPEQKEFLKTFANTLVKNGHAYKKPYATIQWCSAPLIVPKHGPYKFRFTDDLRPVKSHTTPTPWTMPYLDSELNKVSGAKMFACFDFNHGFWQFYLYEQSRDYQ